MNGSRSFPIVRTGRACAAAILATLLPSPAAPPEKAVLPAIQPDETGKRLQSALIWGDPTTLGPGTTLAFRRTFDLSAPPARSTIAIFADARYILWVNGRYIDRGPARFHPNGPEYDLIQLPADLWAAGPNSIAVLVTGNHAGTGQIVRHAPALALALDADGKEVVRTGSAWKWTAQHRYRQIRPTSQGLECALIDARADGGDWWGRSHDDRKWRPAAPADPKAWGPLRARTIPRLAESVYTDDITQPLLPVPLTPGRSVAFETRKLIEAYPAVTLEATAGTELIIKPHNIRFIAKGGRQSFFPLETRAVTKVTVETVKGSGTLFGLDLRERRYPFGRVGKVETNDGGLTGIWRVSARACLTLAQDAYTESADRDRAERISSNPPAFDVTRVAMSGPPLEGGRPANSDPRLFASLLRRTALSTGTDSWVKSRTCSDLPEPPDGRESDACAWVSGLRQYHDATGDLALLRQVWPVAVAQLDKLLTRKTAGGLFSAKDTTLRGNPLADAIGPTATLNAAIFRALADGARLAEALGARAESDRFGREAKSLAAAFNAQLWDPKSGSYFSGAFSEADLAANAAAKRPIPLPVNGGRTPPTLHANVLALDSGIVPADRENEVRTMVIGHVPEQPSGSPTLYYYVFKQLYAADRPALDTQVLDLIRKGWKGMSRASMQMTWETFEGGSRSHVASMFPAYFLSAYVLGVRWSDGVATRRLLLVEPRTSGLRFARGCVVTEAGPVLVAWEIKNGAFVFQIKVPDGITAELAIPRDFHQSLELDRRTIAPKPGADRFRELLSSGEHAGEAR